MACDRVHSSCCSNQCNSPSVCQTLDEMDFERVAGSSFHHCGARTEKSCEVEWPSTSLRWQYQRAAEVVDRSARPGTWGLTMLGGIWSAAMDGDIDRVKSLMKKGIDPNLRDSSNYTALHYASRSGHLAVCQFLLQSGACASPQTLGGATPLHRSAYCGHLDVVRLLLQYRADPLRCDDDGASPLHKAAERGHGEVCELLLHNCPALRSHANKKLQLPHQVAPEGPLQELLRPII